MWGSCVYNMVYLPGSWKTSTIKTLATQYSMEIHVDYLYRRQNDGEGTERSKRDSNISIIQKLLKKIHSSKGHHILYFGDFDWCSMLNKKDFIGFFFHELNGVVEYAESDNSSQS